MELHGLIQQFAHRPDLIFFLGAAIGGQELILPLAFLVGQGLWSLPHLFVIAFIATILVDLMWFTLARLGRKWPWLQKITHKDGNIKKFVQKLSKHEAGLLLVTKFLYGTRVVSVLYLSLDGLKMLRFLLLNMLVTLPWLSIIIAVGWLAGRGSTFFGNILKHPALLTIGAVVLVLVFQWVRKKVEGRLLAS